MNSITSIPLCVLATLAACAGAAQTQADEPVKVLATLQHGKRWSQALAFDRYGKILASASQDHTVRLWDAATGKELHTIKTNYARHLAFSSDGKTVIVLGYLEEDALRTWDVESGKLLAAPSKVRGGMNAAISLDGETVAIETDNLTNRVFDVKSGRMLGAFIQERTLTSGWPALSPDAKTLAVIHAEGIIVLWDIPGRKRRATLRGRPNPLAVQQNVAFTPDSTLLASGGKGNAVTLWQVATGKKKLSFSPHANFLVDEGVVYAVAFSPNGTILASGGSDATVRLCDTAKGKVLATLKMERNEQVSAVAFTPDGRWLAAGSGNGTVMVWDVSSVKAPE